MPAERRRLTRAESQQRTREEVLDAAEELFLAYGLHGTTVAKVAAAAGRTQGAIYANFDSKENLCGQVLLRSYLRTFSALIAEVARMTGPFEDNTEWLLGWWNDMTGDENLVALVAEYALVVNRDPGQLAAFTTHIETWRDMLATIAKRFFPPEVSAQRHEAALNAIVATSTGLALGRTLGTVDAEQAGELMIRTVLLWIAHLRSST